jgi:hypothetical protein
MWRPPICERARHEVSAIQHYDVDLLLYRESFWPLVRPSSLIVL